MNAPAGKVFFVRNFVHLKKHYSVLNIFFMDIINLEEDIRPLSEFRAHAASFVEHVKKTGRPLVLTQYGKSAVVLLDV